MNNEQRKQFELAVETVMKYLADNHNPHTKVIIDSDSAELVEGLTVYQNGQYIKD